MLHAVYRLGSSDSIGVVGIGIIIKGLELPTLFPGQGVAEIGGRVALRVVGDGLAIVCLLYTSLLFLVTLLVTLNP